MIMPRVAVNWRQFGVCVVSAGHPGGDWVRAGHVQLRRVDVADESAHHPRPHALLPQPGRRALRLQSVRLTQLQAGLAQRRTARTPARLASRSAPAHSTVVTLGH